MSTLLELKSELQGYLLAAKAICDAADDANRDFTDGERAEVARLLDLAKGVRAELKKQGGSVLGQLEKPGHGLAPGRSKNWASLEKIMALDAGGASSMIGGQAIGPWGRAFKQSSAGLRISHKQLIEPSGSVAVPVWSATLPALTGEVPAISIMQFIPRETISSDSFVYLQETRREQMAETVAPGETKPTSLYTVERKEDRCKIIAHMSEPVPRSHIADIPLLTAYLDAILREGWRIELEWQILQGAGVGEDFTGIYNVSGTLAQAWDTDVLTTTRKAITALQVVEVSPSGWALNPVDWESCVLSTDDQGAYQLAAAGQLVPVDRARMRLWGKPVGLSNQVPEGSGVLADWRMTHMWEREQVNVSWTESGYIPAPTYDSPAKDLFSANLMLFRCEGREGFAVLRPAAICIVDMAAGS